MSAPFFESHLHQRPHQVLGLAGLVPLGAPQHVHQEGELVPDAEFSVGVRRAPKKLTAEGVSEVQHLQQGIAVAVGQVVLQPGKLGGVVEPKVELDVLALVEPAPLDLLVKVLARDKDLVA